MNFFIQITYMIAATLFIFGIKKLTSPATARRGNMLSALGMLLAVVVTLFDKSILSFEWIIAGLVIGSFIGVLFAKLVKMTAMPQMVALLNGFGGGASALVAVGEIIRNANDISLLTSPFWLSTIMLGTTIGAVTLTGSVIAFAKLQGIMQGNFKLPFHNIVNLLLFVATITSALAVTAMGYNPLYFSLSLAASLLLGILFVVSIGGADMPVVISLLNSLSGIAASFVGFALANNVLIVSGALVGASGLILTQIMCKAMNRSLISVLFGSFGAENGSGVTSATGDKIHRSVGSEEAAMILGYAESVVIVPGFGMAAAGAQHAVRELSDLLESRGANVRFAIHPVAGRMPGHMNVLLAEADVPYEKLVEMEHINPDFERTDVVLVIGANDVVNPAARTAKDSPLYGMPILNVDLAKNVIVIKRSMNAGYAGIDNDLFYLAHTMMLFDSAKEAVAKIVGEVKLL
ncbi:MAG: NAD synthetase [Deltaproteobacteria bacterium CG_4_10_14_0_2_um_filter_43_8]|nr:MAG: NAD synthetase [Deltaproteobacteria bacterium CG11_big_fil_rev_8_21_14_0_20_42_23]PJA19101.1 MAG: NAD synthetase [Deltaproteobacteria bacterium CG_4_10_14_0_2_um_filter_43_8]PJC64929.1 MAG: NAD synthetase [Deltaproteobacteria bacterium CG_4_9_14_0_2_um_filter_42_21]